MAMLIMPVRFAFAYCRACGNHMMKSIPFLWKRTVFLDIVQGILIGTGLAFVTILFILPKVYITKVNGWTSISGCGEPGNGIFLRAACGVVFMGSINVPQEAMYWMTKVDEAGQKLSGAYDYFMHFPLQPASFPGSITRSC